MAVLGSEAWMAARVVGIDWNSCTRLLAGEIVCCAKTSCTGTFPWGVLVTVTASTPPPGQIDPGVHRTQGLLPVMAPWLVYPGLQVQSFCDAAPAGDELYSGHLFDTSAEHQYPAVHARHVEPANPLLHTHWQADDDVMYDAWAGAPEHAWHTRLAFDKQPESWYPPSAHTVQGLQAEDEFWFGSVEYVPMGHTDATVEPAPQ